MVDAICGRSGIYQNYGLQLTFYFISGCVRRRRAAEFFRKFDLFLCISQKFREISNNEEYF